jgi:hypothetical protein
MKLKNEMPEMIKRFSGLKSEIVNYATKLRQKGGYNDFETRLACDCLHATYTPGELCDMYNRYECNDTHLASAAKLALKSIYII